MAKLKYPRDLYADLQRVWKPEPFSEGWPHVDLPEKAVLDEFLDVCYHASLQAEEGRPTIFRVALVASSAPIHPPRQESVGLKSTERYALGRPVPLTVAELRRLAPVADPRRVLIAVEAVGEGEQRSLRIYGLIDVGLSNWEMARHERGMAAGAPHALVVGSTRPGELIIARGHRPVLRLRAGKVVSPARGVLYAGPVAGFFAGATDWLIDEAIRRAEVPASAVHRDEPDDSRDFAHVEFIESVLLNVADLHHGGALLFVPDDVDEERLAESVSLKYRLASDRPQRALLAAITARLEHNVTDERLRERRALKPDHLEELRGYAWHQERMEDAAMDAARFIASLTAVDGAVVLTDKLRIIGFGGEVHVSSGTDTIHDATDAEGTELTAAAFTGYGTRHRSAFRFVEGMDPAIAFILSQDGGIKAATRVGESVVMWSYFEVGLETGLS